MGSNGGRPHTDVEVRAIAPDDVGALATFFGGLPAGDRTFFREDVTDADVVSRWATGDDRHRLVALVGGAVVGYVAVIPGVEWSSHVGELRLAVAPDFRQRGIGRLLAQRAVVEALELGVVKLSVEVVAEQDRLLNMFVKLGFEQEGRLRRHVRDSEGTCHDLLVLSHFVDELAASLVSDGDPTDQR